MVGRWWPIGLALAVLGLSGGEATGSESRTPTLKLVWGDPYRQIPWGSEDVLEDVRSLLGEMGVAVTWCAGEPGSDASDAITVRVLLRPGTSDELGLAANVMGAVMGSASPRDAVFIFLPNVLRTLGHEGGLDPATSPKARSRIQRALARVVAHELIHAVLPERAHDADGIFGAKLNRRLLVSRELVVRADTAAALAARVREAR